MTRPSALLEVAAFASALTAAIVSLALVGDEEWTTLWLLFVPAAVALLPLAVTPGRARRIARVVAAVLLVAWCVVAAASVGLFYVPAAILMVVAAVRGRRR